MAIDGVNFELFGRRTSMRLTAQEIEAMQAICVAENIDRNQFCEEAILKFESSGMNRTQRVKSAILAYYYERAEYQQDYRHRRAG